MKVDLLNLIVYKIDKGRRYFEMYVQVCISLRFIFFLSFEKKKNSNEEVIGFLLYDILVLFLPVEHTGKV